MKKEKYIAPITGVLLTASLLSTVAVATDLDGETTRDSMTLTATVTKNESAYIAIIPAGTGDVVDIYDVDENTVFRPEAEPDATDSAPEAEPDATDSAPEAEPDATESAPEEAEPDATEPAPEEAEPDVTEPAPEEAEPDATEPAPEGAEPDTTESAPEEAEPDVTEPDDQTDAPSPNFEQEID